MSTVYHCVDLRLDRDIAAKVMDPALAADAASRTRFEREARAVAQLNHPCLVNVFDQGVDHRPEGDTVFLIMELVPGGTLRELLRERGPMPPHAALAVMEPVLEALALAHEHGMVHRDVKPDNVLIREDHQVKLADFGLVRAAHRQRRADGGPVLGTAAYLSPEQIRDGAAGPTSDVYSAGILLFELLTGVPPFWGETPDETARMRLTAEVPPPSTRIAGVPPELDELVRRATASDPADRYADGGAFLTAVTDTRRELGLPDFAVPAPRLSAVNRALAGSEFGERRSWDDDAMSTSFVAPVPDNLDPQQAAHTARTRYQDPRAPQPAPQPEIPPTTVQPATTAAAAAPAPARTSHRAPLTNRRPLVTVLWSVVVVVLVAAVALGAWWLTSGRYGEIPQVLGNDVNTARSTVEDAGFTATVNEVWSDDQPQQSVAGTDPDSGSRAVRGSDVAVLVSRGRPTVPQPGDSDTLAAYQSKLSDRTLSGSVSDEVWSDTVPVGVVAEVDPVPGTAVATKSTVTLHLSKGARPVNLPDVTGMSEDRARSTLEAAGVKVDGVDRRFDGDVDGGDALGTTPGAGTEVSSGSTVRLILSSAINVPDVTGKSSSDAQDALREAGLNPVVGDGTDSVKDVDKGDIATQEPSAGSRVDPSQSTTVTLHPSTVSQVPLVIGSTVKDAKKTLKDAGFKVKVTGKSNGRVVTQSPGPLSRKPQGTTVEIRGV
jgi:beta-lactam-binding protein with PASTA domain/serine/threonine protein kinase